MTREAQPTSPGSVVRVHFAGRDFEVDIPGPEDLEDEVSRLVSKVPRAKDEPQVASNEELEKNVFSWSANIFNNVNPNLPPVDRREILVMHVSEGLAHLEDPFSVRILLIGQPTEKAGFGRVAPVAVLTYVQEDSSVGCMQLQDVPMVFFEDSAPTQDQDLANFIKTAFDLGAEDVSEQWKGLFFAHLRDMAGEDPGVRPL